MSKLEAGSSILPRAINSSGYPIIIKMAECKKSENLKKCNCTYPGCERKGICCDCISYHLKRKELPACCFPDDVEKTYDRSFEKFAKIVNERKV